MPAWNLNTVHFNFPSGNKWNKHKCISTRKILQVAAIFPQKVSGLGSDGVAFSETAEEGILSPTAW